MSLTRVVSWMYVASPDLVVVGCGSVFTLLGHQGAPDSNRLRTDVVAAASKVTAGRTRAGQRVQSAPAPNRTRTGTLGWKARIIIVGFVGSLANDAGCRGGVRVYVLLC